MYFQGSFESIWYFLKTFFSLLGKILLCLQYMKKQAYRVCENEVRKIDTLSLAR